MSNAYLDELENYQFIKSLKAKKHKPRPAVKPAHLRAATRAPKNDGVVVRRSVSPPMVSAPHTVKMKSGTARVENKHSILLSRDENDQIFRLLGHRCQSLATAVVQLFTTSAPDHASWNKRATGALCFVKDNPRKSYFFRLYCPNRKVQLWEQEIYNNIEYKAPTAYLHTFEAEDGMAAFNFAHEDEALILKNILQEKLVTRQRKDERRSRSSLQSSRSSATPPKQSTASSNQSTLGSSATWTGGISESGAVVPQHHRSNSAGGQISTPAKVTLSNKRRRHLTKADIGSPIGFKHVSHVGWDPHKGFDIDISDENLKVFFSQAGVSESQLDDHETCQFIYDFIDNHGGIDAVKEEVRKAASSTPPRPGAPPPPAVTPQPPPVPARSNNVVVQQRTAPPPPPSRNMRAPGGRGHAAPKTPSPGQTSPGLGAPPPPPTCSATAPPPPPPPMTGLALFDSQQPAVELCRPTAGTATATPDPRSALLESIRSGRTLKHVDMENKPAAVVPDSRSDLLTEIRQGVELRSVTPNALKSTSQAAGGPQTGLAGALARALAERSRAIHSESDSSGSASEDDEWAD